MNRMETGEKKSSEERLSREEPGPRMLPVRQLF